MDKKLTKQEIEILELVAKSEEEGAYLTEEELVKAYLKAYGN